jgi:23S rRNA (adenine2503-C2)-methyltransferase
MIPLQAVTPEALSDAIAGLTLAEARKIVSAIHRHDALPRSVRAVRRTILEQVRASCQLPTFVRQATQGSKIDPFIKYTLETADGQIIETVRIPLEHPGRLSVCVSSQAGCGLGCQFCATGMMGLRRNLQAWEIIEQVRVVRRALDSPQHQRIHGVVFQGMGEPLANSENVIAAIRVLSEPSGLAIDSRCITVCTAGVPSGIRLLARQAPKARLAISVTSARPEIRRRLMPVDRIYALDEVCDASVEHARITRIAPMWAVTLLSGINDTDEDARALSSLALKFTEATKMRPRISIVPFNSFDHGDQTRFARTSESRERAFRTILSEARLASHKRYSGGGDVGAACGQLAFGARGINPGATLPEPAPAPGHP